MTDHRSVEELSIEELEEVIAIRKRKARHQSRLGRSSRSSKPRTRTRRDRFLLLIEVGILFGLALTAIGVERSREATNQTSVAVQSPPTFTPAPLISAIVLPDGHKPPNAANESAPNFDEIPAHLRAYAESITPIPISTSAPAQATRIQIPALNVDAIVVHGTEWEQLKLGVGHVVQSANPGERGNLVLAAHNDVYGELFRYLDRLKPGDEVIVYAGQQRYRYVIASSRIIEPTQVEVMASTSTPTVTLISCYPYLIDTQRIAVFGDLQS
jgi:sortase A